MSQAISTLLLPVLLLQAAAAYDFNLAGVSDGVGFGNRMYTSANYYASNSLSPKQYTSDLLSALNSAKANTNAVASGFGNATAEALEQSNYKAFNYECEAAVSFNPIPNGGEGPEGASYCYYGVDQAKSHGVNTTAATDAAFAAGKAIDAKFGTDVADNYPRASFF